MNPPPSRANGSHITLPSVDQPPCAQNATRNPTQRDKMVLPSPVATAFPRTPQSPGEWGQPKKPVGRTDAMAQRPSPFERSAFLRKTVSLARGGNEGFSDRPRFPAEPHTLPDPTSRIGRFLLVFCVVMFFLSAAVGPWKRQWLIGSLLAWRCSILSRRYEADLA